MPCMIANASDLLIIKFKLWLIMLSLIMQKKLISQEEPCYVSKCGL